ncbi:hypothetical protein VTN00DRAFT_6787 [Thermoascus crustaceus]|uniref:uncharacterized protein n=1 Tax=Thermoascus crustaceus TaxID=5088 RepID=UPI0037429C68
MKRATERAGALFTGWISSCFSCLWCEDNDEAYHHQQALRNRGVEREMKICHSQPHLVPPMKLVFYDDLPSPAPPRRSSTLASWAVEGRRSIASRTSNRASLTFKRKSTARPTISAPSDFRRVDGALDRPDLDPSFRPLELSIYKPGNRLSNLPEFENFQLFEEKLPSPPPRALSPTFETSSSRRYQHQSAPYQLTRKPVGSGSRRSSLATMEQLIEFQKPVADPLIPHFATRAPQSAPIDGSFPHARRRSEPFNVFSKGKSSGDQERIDQIPVAVASKPQRGTRRPSVANILDRPLPPTPEQAEVRASSPPSTPGPATPSSPARSSLRSGRIARWLQGQSSSPQQSSPSKHSTTSSQSQNVLAHSRSRTLSGSTVGSSIMSTNGGGFNTVTSLSSALSAATTVRVSSDGLAEKEIEAAVPLPVHSSTKYNMGTSRLDSEPMYPTIYEGEQRHENEYEQPFRASTVGLAF